MESNTVEQNQTCNDLILALTGSKLWAQKSMLILSFEYKRTVWSEKL